MKRTLGVMTVALAVLAAPAASSASTTQGPTHLSPTSNSCAKRNAGIIKNGSGINAWVLGGGWVEIFSWTGTACSTTIHRNASSIAIDLWYERKVPLADDDYDGNVDGWVVCVYGGGGQTVSTYYLDVTAGQLTWGELCVQEPVLHFVSTGDQIRVRNAWTVVTTDTVPVTAIGNIYDGPVTM